MTLCGCDTGALEPVCSVVPEENSAGALAPTVNADFSPSYNSSVPTFEMKNSGMPHSSMGW